MNRDYSLQNSSTGDLSSWIHFTTSSELLDRQAYSQFLDAFYLLGGRKVGIPISLSSVFKGSFADNGTLSWVLEGSNLPLALEQGRAAIVEKWIYYVGGFTNFDFNRSNIIFKSKILNDGSLDDWSIAGYMPDKLSGFSLFSSQNKLIIAGGINSSGVTIKTVRSATINTTNGNIIEWNVLNDLPESSNCQAYTQTKSGALVIGGWGSGNNLNSVYYSAFDSNGNTGNWIKSQYSLPWSTCTATAITLGKYIYVMGGFAVGPGQFGATNVVWKARLDPKVLGLDPVIIVPGMGASYHNVLLHLGYNAPNEEWKLAPYVKNYDVLIDNFKRAGYEMDKNLFVYNYDWRKPVADNALALSQFISDKKLKNVNLVGHSMGGLISARYSTLQPENVNNLITLGSPFLGATKVYKIWEGAELSDFSGFERTAISLFLNVHAGKYDSDVVTIQKNIPSFLNVFPVYDFLKKQNGKIIPVAKLTWRNNFWEYLKGDLEPIATKSAGIYGSGIDTDEIYTVTNRNIIDHILGKWEDGKPVETDYSSGDDTVLVGSSKFEKSTHIAVDEVLHGNLPSNPTVWQKISDRLELNTNPSPAPEIPDKYLIMAMGSPATFEVIDPLGQTYSPTDGILSIGNPANGEYRVKIIPLEDQGEYNFYFGRVLGDDYAWDDYSSDAKHGETLLNYSVNWEAKNLGSDPKNRALSRLKMIDQGLKAADINTGEKQVLSKMMEDLESNITMLSEGDDKLRAEILRTCMQKIGQVEKAWNNRDPEYSQLVTYNLRKLMRDVLEEWENY